MIVPGMQERHGKYSERRHVVEEEREEYSEDKRHKNRLKLNEEKPEGAEREELRREVLRDPAGVALAGALRWRRGDRRGRREELSSFIRCRVPPRFVRLGARRR